MIFGYARISTKDQNLKHQLLVLNSVCDKVIIEKAPGKSTSERPELQGLISYLRGSDMLIVKSIDRLARNTKELLA
ncbi:recombinase family protein [Chania multitudinisentens]|uniref:recombinase family protein n=1 Tax=Chania multitudinisentens TaxID=1639108 RepID=UPI0006865698|nr:recombinase family protein [Chania multitudinisentens]